MTLIEAQHLVRRGPADRRLLDDVGLAVAAGDRLVVSGPSGSGKTLLLRALALLDRLDGGAVLFQGRPIDARRAPDFRRQVLYLHQRASLAEPTVEEALRRPYSLAAHAGRHFDPEAARRLLASLGRGEDFLSQRTADLSGGEAQLAALVRALQLDPLVLLLDEPTAALDPASAALAEEALCRWIGQRPDRAWLWVTHDAALAARVGNRAVVLAAGRILDPADGAA